MAIFRLLLAAMVCCDSLAVMPDFSLEGRGSAVAVGELLQRVLGTDPASVFELTTVKTCSTPPPATSRSKLCFEIGPGSKPGRIAVSGTSGVELARGAAHYLRQKCNMSFAWNRTGGNNVVLPKVWPAPDRAVRYRTVEYSYFQNVVESSYSFAFYGWAEWEAMIDWQALTGINLGLAYTGQEEIYRKTFATFGVNDSTFGNWTNGPAWLAWSRGQSMHGVGASGQGSPGHGISLTQSWMTAQHALQKQILKRMRDLGIVPVLPAFQGNVPPIMKSELYPTANISVQGGGRHYAAWLDGVDPLFGQIADRYMQIMCADFGCQDHWYEADGYFAAGRPPWYTEAPSSTASPPSPSSQELGVESATSATVESVPTLFPEGAMEASHQFHFAAALASQKNCCCHDSKCSLPAKPACCSCCPPAPIDPAVVANARTHAIAAYTGLNRTDPKAIWFYQVRRNSHGLST
jgi:alpha-N-acetylglucosaminidase